MRARYFTVCSCGWHYRNPCAMDPPPSSTSMRYQSWVTTGCGQRCSWEISSDNSSPATTHTPLLGADVHLELATQHEIPVDETFEHAVMLIRGRRRRCGSPLAVGPLLYLSPGRSSIEFTTSDGAHLLLLGGEPFEEELVMWWNFIGRTHDEIAEARGPSGRKGMCVSVTSLAMVTNAFRRRPCPVCASGLVVGRVREPSTSEQLKHLFVAGCREPLVPVADCLKVPRCLQRHLMR